MDCVNDDVTLLVLTHFLGWHLKGNGKSQKKCAVPKGYTVLLDHQKWRRENSAIMTVNSNRLYSSLVQNMLLDCFLFSICQECGNRAANTFLV